jgi:hypothetical protein
MTRTPNHGMNRSNVDRAKQARQEQKQRGRDDTAARRRADKQQPEGPRFQPPAKTGA